MKKALVMGVAFTLTLGLAGICSAGEGHFTTEQSIKHMESVQTTAPAAKTKINVQPRENYTVGLESRMADYEAKINAGTMTQADKESLVADIKASWLGYGKGRQPVYSGGMTSDEIAAHNAFEHWDYTDNQLRHLGHKANLDW